MNVIRSVNNLKKRKLTRLCVNRSIDRHMATVPGAPRWPAASLPPSDLTQTSLVNNPKLNHTGKEILGDVVPADLGHQRESHHNVLECIPERRAFPCWLDIDKKPNSLCSFTYLTTRILHRWSLALYTANFVSHLLPCTSGAKCHRGTFLLEYDLWPCTYLQVSQHSGQW